MYEHIDKAETSMHVQRNHAEPSYTGHFGSVMLLGFFAY